MDNWSPCPRCNSNKVKEINKWLMSLGVFGSSGCLIWVGFLFPPLWLLVPILMIISFIMLFGKSAWQCQDCNYTWTKKKTTDYGM